MVVMRPDREPGLQAGGGCVSLGHSRSHSHRPGSLPRGQDNGACPHGEWRADGKLSHGRALRGIDAQRSVLLITAETAVG